MTPPGCAGVICRKPNVVSLSSLEKRSGEGGGGKVQRSPLCFSANAYCSKARAFNAIRPSFRPNLSHSPSAVHPFARTLFYWTLFCVRSTSARFWGFVCFPAAMRALSGSPSPVKVCVSERLSETPACCSLARSLTQWVFVHLIRYVSNQMRLQTQ